MDALDEQLKAVIGESTSFEVEDFDPSDPLIDIVMVARHEEAAIAVRLGWGSNGMHIDVYGWRDSERIEPDVLTLGDVVSVFVPS